MSLEMLGLVVLSASGAALLLAAPIALVVAWAWTWHIAGKRFDQTSRALEDQERVRIFPRWQPIAARLVSAVLAFDVVAVISHERVIFYGDATIAATTLGQAVR